MAGARRNPQRKGARKKSPGKKQGKKKPRMLSRPLLAKRLAELWALPEKGISLSFVDETKLEAIQKKFKEKTMNIEDQRRLETIYRKYVLERRG
jgi:hypothetical protein